MVGQSVVPQAGVDLVQEPFLLLTRPDRLVLLVMAEEEPYADVETHVVHRSVRLADRIGDAIATPSGFGSAMCHGTSLGSSSEVRSRAEVVESGLDECRRPSAASRRSSGAAVRRSRRLVPMLVRDSGAVELRQLEYWQSCADSLTGSGIFAIAEGLTADRHPCPSGPRPCP